MLKQSLFSPARSLRAKTRLSPGAVLKIREACLVKRRSLPHSTGCLTCDGSSFTNGKGECFPECRVLA